MNRNFAPLFLLMLLASGRTFAQETTQFSLRFEFPDARSLVFVGAEDRDGWPYHIFRTELDGPGKLDLQVIPQEEDQVTLSTTALPVNPSDAYRIGGIVEQDRHRWYARIWISPVRQTGPESFHRMKSGIVSMRLHREGATQVTRSDPDFKSESMLANGRVHKISVSEPGIYKLDFNFIKDKLGVDPGSLTVGQIGIYGNGGGRIPQSNAAPRIDDLEACAVQRFGLDDGVFQQGDYLLWYAEGPDSWSYDPVSRTYQMDKNIYDDRNHYYILLDGPGSPVMPLRENASNGDYVSAASLEAQRLEDEKVNLLGRFRPPGSGQEWYGDEMSVVNQFDYAGKFDFSGLVQSDSVHVKLRFAIRAASSPRIFLRINQQEFNRTVGGVNLDNYESSFANDGILQAVVVPGQPIQQLQVSYPAASGVNSRAWVDYLQVNFWRHNTYQPGNPLLIRDPRAAFLGTPAYSVSGLPAGILIWDITHPQMPVRQAYTAGSSATFTGPAPDPDQPATYLCFDPSRDVRIPEYRGVVANQNLHGLTAADLIIVYYDEYASAAETLAAHRRQHSGLEVVHVPVSQVFEEFGGGSADPSALRDFARMMYVRDPGFKYLMLIGDATYDYLNRNKELPYHNYIPAFETEESLDPIRSFPADDFYALLDEQEGANLVGAIDIAVGRLPVSAPEEADLIVQKIIHYDTHPATLGDWRNRVVMVADDQDGNIHLGQADGLANETAQQWPVLNQEKIYLDAFPQESTPGGDRYPAVNSALDQSIQQGALTVTYLGHGGPNGWTQERVLGINQAQSYTNGDNLPLFITATCSFAGYDEPGFTSAGEHLLVNPAGGAIALMTTVRAVFSGSNARLTGSVLDHIYLPDQPGVYPPVGEILRRAKNDNALDTLDTNARKFTLLGDPAMVLAMPRYRVAVTRVGEVDAGSGLQDTLSALEQTTVSGVILDDDGEVIDNFQGRIYLTLFDKAQVRKTLGNDVDSPVREFTTQNKQLFRGTASVINGEWTIDFALPKDIDFSYGKGKMSLYAENGSTDAAGYYTDFLIGGVSAEGLADDEPPLVRAFMNDTNFVSGGMTDAHPDIYLVLSDDFGINVSGTSVGHDIEAILDGDTRNAIILNDYYQAALDDFRRGTVRFPLQGLAPGRHTLHVTAWDLANNPGEATIEFYVVDQQGPLVTNLACYPNPFREETRFYFEHNRPGRLMNASLQIYNLQGVPVSEIRLADWATTGYRVDELVWDGTSASEAPLPPGMYIYRLKVEFLTGQSLEVVETKAGKVVLH